MRIPTRTDLIESLKYDAQAAKLPLTLLGEIAAAGFDVIGKYPTAFRIISAMYSSGWAGSAGAAGRYAKKVYAPSEKGQQRRRAIHSTWLDQTSENDRTARFYNDPTQLFESIVIVLRSASSTRRGVIVVNYSSYFPLVQTLFDLERIAQSYVIVLEPSWAGFCDPNVLSYADVGEPVVVQSWEPRDAHLLREINAGLVPVNLGNSCWIDHRMFVPRPDLARDIDVVMVAAWGDYKRHHRFFEAVASLRRGGRLLNVTLAGYGDGMDSVRASAENRGILDQLTFVHQVPPQQVAELYARARVNVLWSRFEGNNRAIVEGMLCDTPCILREGHNFGHQYDFINSTTGRFATEAQLPEALVEIIDHPERYAPREWVMENRSCIGATLQLERTVDAIGETDPTDDLADTSLAVKLNHLDGMIYFDEADRSRFAEDYEFLRKAIRKPQ